MKKTLMLLLITASFSLSCQGNAIGLACTVDKECDYGQSCFMNGFPGGFCTKGCVREGSITECPQGTICARATNGTTLFCALPCKSDGDCRGGQYVCAAVMGSTEQACRP